MIVNIFYHFNILQIIENGEGGVDVLSEVAMMNAYFICHNVQVICRDVFLLITEPFEKSKAALNLIRT